jgi:hypothetical protein
MLSVAASAGVFVFLAIRDEVSEFLAFEASPRFREFFAYTYVFSFNEKTGLDGLVGCVSVIESYGDMCYFLGFVAA